MLTFEDVLLTQGTFSLTANVTLPDQTITALIGPSGAGKSTLLSAIAGFFAPVQGRVCWAGTDLTGVAPGARPVSMLFQDNNLFPHLTAFQNVGLGLRPDLRLSGAETDAINAALEQVGLDGYADRKPGALSGGQQSRVALVGQPIVVTILGIFILREIPSFFHR